jgi:hypothetical protein
LCYYGIDAPSAGLSIVPTKFPETLQSGESAQAEDRIIMIEYPDESSVSSRLVDQDAKRFTGERDKSIIVHGQDMLGITVFSLFGILCPMKGTSKTSTSDSLEHFDHLPLFQILIEFCSGSEDGVFCFSGGR